MLIKDTYEVREQLLNTTFGSLYSGINIKTKEKVSFRQYRSMLCEQPVVDNLIDLIYKTSVLKHPNIVRIIDINYEEEQNLWLVYDTPYEGNLEEYTAKIVKFPLDTAQSIILEVGKALEYAHLKGIIHGGINMRNIWLQPDGHIKIANFAIDHLLNFYMLKKNVLLLPTTFIPPEQFKSVVIQRTTDTFALAVLLYKLLSGKNPYPDIEDHNMHLFNLQKGVVPLTLVAKDVPQYIEDIVMRSLNKEPRLRHHSVAEFLGDLNAKQVTITVAEAQRKIAESEKIVYHKSETNLPKERGPVIAKSVNRSPEKKNISASAPAKTLKIDRQRLIVTLLILAGLIGIVLSILQALFLSYINSTPTLYVPNVIGRPLEMARQEIAHSGLRSKVTSYTVNNQVSANHVIDCNPSAGRLVKKNRIIKLSVSRGAEKMEIPLLVGKSFSQAKTIAEQRGFFLQIIGYTFSNDSARDVILKQDPPENTVTEQSTTINVVISKGFPASLELIEDLSITKKVLLTVSVPQNWTEQNVEIFLYEKGTKVKLLEIVLSPGEELVRDLNLDNNSTLEVFSNKEMILRQIISDLRRQAL